MKQRFSGYLFRALDVSTAIILALLGNVRLTISKSTLVTEIVLFPLSLLLLYHV
ncbi:MAG TPA: hypothetical protein VJR22_07955 [Candidatus Nitrosotalea sp.]|nr:hypothetical protein [Candidatus Nitrosotalea sp.]